ncbi:MAG: hypothetical protein ACK41T_09450 [Pseudobdellovibrio sp.]
MKTINYTLSAIITVCTFINFNLQAQTLTAELGDKKLENYALANKSIYKDSGVTAELKPTSHGIRQIKAFGLLPVKVYSAQLLAAKPENLIKDDSKIIDSFANAGPVQLRLTMLRDLKGQQISESFIKALETNGITEQNYSDQLKTVMSEISSIKEFKKGEVFSIATTFTADNGTMLLQKPDSSIKKITGNPEFIKNMFLIWFGKPVDDKLASLKKELLK